MTRLLLAGVVLWIVAVLGAGPSAQLEPHRTPAAQSGASLFSTSDNCVACHNGLTAPDGEDLSIGVAWRSTMMANSARDPYFQAGLRRETIDHPSLSAEIQDECAGCHAPMLQRAAHAEGRTPDLFGQLQVHGSGQSAGRQLAADGVSCTVCHQISPEGLGTRASFNGGFVLRPTPVGGAREIFGPYKVDAARTTIMRSVTGFAQAEAPHVRESALCATCHTLYTKARGPGGEVLGELPEQMNFQEWQHSAFNAEQRSCQSCHMPAVRTPTRIASVLGEEREGFSRHAFVGGNFFVLRMLNRYRADLGVEALPSELEATARATVRQLETETAALSIAEACLDGGTLTLVVEARNLTGHKLPTGYPSRRAWLHLVVRDADGLTVFESGAVTPDGAITGNDNDVDPRAFEPHYDEIRGSDQVQIYESVMAAPGGRLTTGLLSATHYVKDNRLLPRGFDKRTAHADIAVHGGAAADVNFTDAGDRVRYVVAAAGARGPLQVDAELLYQPIGFRWAQNLRPYEAPEPQRFVRYFAAMSSATAATVARATVRIEQ